MDVKEEDEEEGDVGGRAADCLRPAVGERVAQKFAKLRLKDGSKKIPVLMCQSLTCQWSAFLRQLLFRFVLKEGNK